LERRLAIPFLFAQLAFDPTPRFHQRALLGRRSEQRGFSDVISEEEDYET